MGWLPAEDGVEDRSDGRDDDVDLEDDVIMEEDGLISQKGPVYGGGQIQMGTAREQAPPL